MITNIVIIALLLGVLSIIAKLKHVILKIVMIALVIMGGLYLYPIISPYLTHQNTQQATAPQVTTQNTEQPAQPAQPAQPTQPEQPAEQTGVIPKLTGNESSKTAYGATFVMGDLDSFGRATYAHILVSDAQEPGSNHVKRDEHINASPAGWHNYKINNKFWAYNRTHLVGWQFSGINDDTRNLVSATAWVNKAKEANGLDASNPEGMLYYENQLDSWLANHPNYKLDYYVRPNYNGSENFPRSIYMQWVGVDSNGNTLPININGKSQQLSGDYYGVTLENVSPSFTFDYTNGQILSTK